MGDRANVYVHSGDRPGVYLYTHNAGTALPETVRAALKRAAEDNRLQDEPYLTRIIFSEMINGYVMSTTGFGISAEVQDGQDRITDVDVARQTITVPGHKPVPLAQYVVTGTVKFGKPAPGDRETTITLTVGPVNRRK